MTRVCCIVKQKSKTLFWQIINCQLNALKGCGCPGCERILSCQKESTRVQVSEPWSGDIDNASVLFIGENPALCKEEVFPSRKNVAPYDWDNCCAGCGTWSPSDVEAYFEGRFGVAKCPRCQLPYFNRRQQLVRMTDGLTCYDRKIQNPYWLTYNKYYTILCPQGQDYGFATTDIVHCKGPKREGLLEASACCRQHTRAIVDLFLSNGAASHSILVFGASSENYVKMIWPNVNLQSAVKVGTYDYKRFGIHQKDILEFHMSHRLLQCKVYFGLPVPSRSNQAARHIMFCGCQV